MNPSPGSSASMHFQPTQRVTDMLLQPRTTWPVVAQVASNIAGIYRHHRLFLAAIAAVAGLIGLSLAALDPKRLAQRRRAAS